MSHRHALIAAALAGVCAASATSAQAAGQEEMGTPKADQEMCYGVAKAGQNDCGTGMLTTLMSWLDGHNAGYLAWTWDTWGTACTTLSLITDYAGTPTALGQVFKDHLTRVVASTPTPVACTPDSTPTCPPVTPSTLTSPASRTGRPFQGTWIGPYSPLAH